MWKYFTGEATDPHATENVHFCLQVIIYVYCLSIIHQSACSWSSGDTQIYYMILFLLEFITKQSPPSPLIFVLFPVCSLTFYSYSLCNVVIQVPSPLHSRLLYQSETIDSLIGHLLV